jgi:hypothetical protein
MSELFVSSETIDLHFYSPSNKGYDLSIESNATVLQLKHKLSSLVKIKKEYLLIVINDEILGDDTASLEEYHIRHKDMMHFYVRPCSTLVEYDDYFPTKPSFTHRIRT